LQIAGIFEFVGAMVLGRVSTNTIKDGVIDITAFYREPEMVMYGMMVALLVAAVWNIGCCVIEMNVSSTHSISKYHLMNASFLYDSVTYLIANMFVAN
jgi:solute carrier family 20 (sodium-dependent phosphate transporter)